MSLFPVRSSRLQWLFQAANTVNLAFLPPAVPGLSSINGKLIGGKTPAHYENFT
jgi:hypothetical protein